MFGSGGRTNGRRVVDGRGDQRRPSQPAEVEAGLGDGEATDEVARQLVGRAWPAGSARTVSTRPMPTVYSCATSSMSRMRASSLGGQRLAEQVLDVEDLDAALAHAGDELVVLPLGPLDPQDVVEQELVVVARGQALEAQVGPVDDDLPQLADLGVDAERTLIACRSLLQRATTRRSSGGAGHQSLDVCSSEPITARLPVASANSMAAATFGPIEPAGKSIASSSVGRDPVDAARWSGVPQSAYTPSTSVAITNRSASSSRASRLRGEVLVDDGLDADQLRGPRPARTSSGCRRRRRR